MLTQVTIEDVQVLHRLQVRRKFLIRAVVVCLVPIALLTETTPLEHGWISISVEALGLLLIAICVVGRTWCSLYIGGKKSIELIETGPYSVSRNPLYLFACLGAFGVAVCSGSWVFCAAVLLAAPVIFLPVIRAEELVLSRTFKTAFEHYSARVPRFGPRIAGWQDATLLEVEPIHFYRAIRDSLCFAAALPLLNAITWLHGHGFLPTLLRLP